MIIARLSHMKIGRRAFVSHLLTNTVTIESEQIFFNGM
jgi:hypothetical protein